MNFAAAYCSFSQIPRQTDKPTLLTETVIP
jgi:hypothetical protein